MPPCGHTGDQARMKKYAASRAAKIIASVAMSTTMPHHPSG